MTVTTPESSTVPNFDFAPDAVLRVGVVTGEHLWLDRPGVIARVRATDLRGVAQRTQAVREERREVPVLVDIQVMIAPDAHSARAAVDLIAPVASDTLLYVGTPAGLAGLVTDIHALGIADGAVLIPLHGGEVLDLIWERVLPELQSHSPFPPDLTQARPA